jgi:hypothetical protein
MNIEKMTLNNNELMVKQVSDKDMANGWRVVMPTKFNKTYNLNIYLTQLPPHLWKHLFLYFNTDIRNDDDDEYVNMNKLDDNKYQYFSYIKNDNYNFIPNGEFKYKNIREGPYIYSINKTEYDNDIIELYNLVTDLNGNLDREYILSLYNNLKDNNFNGWLMIKTKQLLKLI